MRSRRTQTSSVALSRTHRTHSSAAQPEAHAGLCSRYGLCQRRQRQPRHARALGRRGHALGCVPVECACGGCGVHVVEDRHLAAATVLACVNMGFELCLMSRSRVGGRGVASRGCAGDVCARGVCTFELACRGWCARWEGVAVRFGGGSVRVRGSGALTFVACGEGVAIGRQVDFRHFLISDTKYLQSSATRKRVARVYRVPCSCGCALTRVVLETFAGHQRGRGVGDRRVDGRKFEFTAITGESVTHISAV